MRKCRISDPNNKLLFMRFVPLDNQCRTSKLLQTGTSLDDLVNGIFIFCSLNPNSDFHSPGRIGYSYVESDSETESQFALYGAQTNSLGWEHFWLVYP